MMKTATILQPCAFNFTYGARETIEYLTGMHIVMPGDGTGTGAGITPGPAPHPSQAVRDNNPDVSARIRQMAIVPRDLDPRLINANHQIMTILRNYARDHAIDAINDAQCRGALLYPDAPRGPSVAGPGNFTHYQNPPAQMGPSPATAPPPNAGRTRAEEIDGLRQFSSGLPSSPRPVTVGDPQQPASHPGSPHTPTYPNIAPGFTAINARSTASPVDAGTDVSTAVPAGRPRRVRRSLADPLSDSNALGRSGSNAGNGVPAHTQQALAFTSATGVSVSVSATTNAASNMSVTAPSSAAPTSGVDDSGAGPADPNSGSEGRGVTTSAVTEGVTHGASADENAANVTKVDDQDSSNADMAVTAQDPAAALAPDGSTGNAAVPVNDTTESGSKSGHSPPHKKRKVNEGDSGGTAGGNDA
jgi:hypothetical protein